MVAVPVAVPVTGVTIGAVVILGVTICWVDYLLVPWGGVSYPVVKNTFSVTLLTQITVIEQRLM